MNISILTTLSLEILQKFKIRILVSLTPLRTQRTWNPSFLPTAIYELTIYHMRLYEFVLLCIHKLIICFMKKQKLFKLQEALPRICREVLPATEPPTVGHPTALRLGRTDFTAGWFERQAHLEQWCGEGKAE